MNCFVLHRSSFFHWMSVCDRFLPLILHINFRLVLFFLNLLVCLPCWFCTSKSYHRHYLFKFLIRFFQEFFSLRRQLVQLYHRNRNLWTCWVLIKSSIHWPYSLLRFIRGYSWISMVSFTNLIFGHPCFNKLWTFLFYDISNSFLVFDSFLRNFFIYGSLWLSSAHVSISEYILLR